MGAYRVIELHPSDESLSRWFCLVCQDEVPQSGTMAPACPARLAHEASAKHLAAVARKPAITQSRPQNLLQQRVDARPTLAPHTSIQRRAAKRAKHVQDEALEHGSGVSDPVVNTLCAAADMLETWLPAAQTVRAKGPRSHYAGQCRTPWHSMCSEWVCLSVDDQTRHATKQHACCLGTCAGHLHDGPQPAHHVHQLAWLHAAPPVCHLPLLEAHKGACTSDAVHPDDRAPLSSVAVAHRCCSAEPTRQPSSSQVEVCFDLQC